MDETVKKEFAAVRTDIAGLKQDVTGLKDDVADIRSVNRRIIATLVRLEGKVDDMGAQMATKDDISTLTKRLSKIESRRA